MVSLSFSFGGSAAGALFELPCDAPLSSLPKDPLAALHRDLDKQVERTKMRPLASGAVSVPKAIGFLGLQLSAGLGILLQLNTYTQVLGVASLGLVATYPLMKRFTYWPQVSERVSQPPRCCQAAPGCADGARTLLHLVSIRHIWVSP